MSDEVKTVKIPVVSNDDIDASEIIKMATDELFTERKRELSGKIVKLFHKADQLRQDVEKHARDGKKASEKLDKTIQTIQKLKAGDWSVLKDLDGKDEN